MDPRSPLCLKGAGKCPEKQPQSNPVQSAGKNYTFIFNSSKPGRESVDLFHSMVQLKRPNNVFYWWVLNPTGRSTQGQTPIKQRIWKKTRSKLSTEMQPGKLGWTRSILHVMRSNLAFNFSSFFLLFYLFIYFKYRFRCFSAMKKGKKVHKLREKAEIKQ